MPTFTAFVDLQQAFDCVNRDFLMNKILDYGIDGKVFSEIKSFYINTEACLKLRRGLFIDWNIKRRESWATQMTEII